MTQSEMKSFVKSFTVTKFAQHILSTDLAKRESEQNRVLVYLDSKIYPNDFGISVRPLQVKYGSFVIDMKQLIDLFGNIPYITVKENRYRSVYRDPMLMTIDLTPKVFNDNTYYDYYIDKLFLRSEIKKYISIEKKAHDIIKEFKQNRPHSGVRTAKESIDSTNESVEEYRSSDE